VNVRFHPDVYKQLQQLPRNVFAVALDTIIGLSRNPRPTGVRKLVGSDGDWRVRIGEYRIIYEIDDSARAVTIMRVTHRRDSYR
jgi:mRNA interferase RelE/StbE